MDGQDVSVLLHEPMRYGGILRNLCRSILRSLCRGTLSGLYGPDITGYWSTRNVKRRHHPMPISRQSARRKDMFENEGRPEVIS